MYAIVRNVVTPAKTSVRTVVWFSDNLNNRSIFSIPKAGAEEILLVTTQLGNPGDRESVYLE